MSFPGAPRRFVLPNPVPLEPVAEGEEHNLGHYAPDVQGDVVWGDRPVQQQDQWDWGQRSWNADHRRGDRRDDRRGAGYGGNNRGGSGSAGSGQRVAAVHNPFEMRKPDFVAEAIVDSLDVAKNSMIILDNRDDRIISPFQNWLVEEIMSNAASSINVLTERDQVMPPSSGFQCSLFANYTLDGVKAVLVLTIGSRTGATCAAWDSATAQALSHEAFQPFVWPLMNSTTATYVDVKFFNGNEVLFHWIFRGYRSDSDMTVQQQFCDESLIKDARRGRFRPSLVVAVFRGWQVSVFSFEVGGRSYSVGPHGTVVAGDYGRCNCELRVTDRSSPESLGNDADRVEFRFRDANNRIDLKCGRVSVPGTWLAVSHISGPALINTIERCRGQRARVEGPDQVQQFAQMATIFAPWFRNSETTEDHQTGVLACHFEMLNPADFHLRARSKLRIMAPHYVDQAAIAHRSHEDEFDAQFVSLGHLRSPTKQQGWRQDSSKRRQRLGRSWTRKPSPRQRRIGST